MSEPSYRLQLSSKKPSSLADQVYEHLRNTIICADLLPGEKLIEMDIAAQMGTSQGPVREALQRLERDGLVERKARSASFVSSISIDEMYEMFSIRSVIEGFAIRRTAQTISVEQCDQMDDLIRKMADSGVRREIVPLAEYDMQFHRRIVDWSGVASFMQAWTPLSSQIQRFIVQTHPEHYPDYVEIGMRHQPIAAALRRHDSEGAARLVQENIMLIWPKINP